jgi:hypothetical protein
LQRPPDNFVLLARHTPELICAISSFHLLVPPSALGTKKLPSDLAEARASAEK